MYYLIQEGTNTLQGGRNCNDLLNSSVKPLHVILPVKHLQTNLLKTSHLTHTQVIFKKLPDVTNINVSSSAKFEPFTQVVTLDAALSLEDR